MRTLKPVFGVLGAVVPLIYCGGLLYYFLDVSGSVENAQTIGLGPTVLGLGLVGLLFCIPLIIKVMRLFSRPRSPGSRGGPDAPADDDKSGVEAEAAIARYLAAQRSAGSSAPIVSPARGSSGPVGRPAFGRKAR
jgi:hypothetical protein